MRAFAVELNVLPQTVYNWLANKTSIDDERAAQIAAALDMSVIDVRRGLGLWVPPPAKDHDSDAADPPDAPNRRHDDYENLREKVRQADIPESAKRFMLDTIDHEESTKNSHYRSLQNRVRELVESD